jgi:hypothetical protein
MQMTPRELEPIIRERADLIKDQNRLQFEVMRIQTLYLTNIQLKREDRFKDVFSFMPFEWDNEGEETPVTKINMDAFKKFMGGRS